MMNKSCGDLVDYMLQNGAIISEEKQEGSENFFGRTVVLKKDSCTLKISYLNLHDKELVVQKVCCCEKTNGWISIPNSCFQN